MHHLIPSLHTITDAHYYLLFPLMVVEGPAMMVIAGLLSSLGYYELEDIFYLAFVATLIGDLLHYAIGWYGRLQLIRRWGRYLGVTEERVLRIEKHFKDHPGKTLVIAKLSFAFAGITLIAAGIARMRLSKFLGYSIIGELPKIILLVSAGYYFGDAYAKIDRYLSYSVTMIFIIGVLAVGGYLLSRNFSKRLEA